MQRKVRDREKNRCQTNDGLEPSLGRVISILASDSIQRHETVMIMKTSEACVCGCGDGTSGDGHGSL